MDDGTPAMILEETMRIILNCHDDFKNEKSALHNILGSKGHVVP